MRVPEDKQLRRIFRPNREEITRQQKISLKTAKGFTICTPNRSGLLLPTLMKEDGMGEAHSMHGEISGKYKIVVGKAERIGQFGIPWLGRKDTVKMDHSKLE